MDLNGISPVQNLILHLLRSTQQEETPLQVQGDKQPIVPRNVQVDVQAVSQTPNALGKDSIDHVIAMPERSLSNVLPNVLAGALQGIDFQSLAEMFVRLGMNYEKRLLKALNLEDALQGQAFEEIKDTVKGQLIVAAKHDPEAKLWLEHLTSLQMKQTSDSASHVYFVLDLPYSLRDRSFQARIAVYGNKKGKTIDLEHCRIGLSTLTDALGEVGIDALFRERSITVNLITEVPQMVSALWEELKAPIMERFASQGYGLSGVHVSGIADERFKAFLRGIEPEGVDIKV